MQTEINFILGKNQGHMPSSLDGKLIAVVRQQMDETKMLVVYIFKIW